MTETQGAIDPDQFDSDRFYDSFKDEHSGHEKQVDDGFNETVHCSFTGISKPTTATAYCPLCDVEEKVIYHDRICPHHSYGEHIDIYCDQCGESAHTKNIKSIGSRSIYQSCSCVEGWFFHLCPKQTENKIRDAQVKGEALLE